MESWNDFSRNISRINAMMIQGRAEINHCCLPLQSRRIICKARRPYLPRQTTELNDIAKNGMHGFFDQSNTCHTLVPGHKAKLVWIIVSGLWSLGTKSHSTGQFVLSNSVEVYQVQDKIFPCFILDLLHKPALGIIRHQRSSSFKQDSFYGLKFTYISSPRSILPLDSKRWRPWKLELSLHPILEMRSQDNQNLAAILEILSTHGNTLSEHLGMNFTQVTKYVLRMI